TPKVRALPAYAKKSSLASSSCKEGVQSFAQLLFVVCEVNQEFNVIGDYGQTIVWSKLIDESFRGFDTVGDVRKLTATVVDDQDDRTWKTRVVPQHKMADLLRYIVFTDFKVSRG